VAIEIDYDQAATGRCHDGICMLANAAETDGENGAWGKKARGDFITTTRRVETFTDVTDTPVIVVGYPRLAN